MRYETVSEHLSNLSHRALLNRMERMGMDVREPELEHAPCRCRNCHEKRLKLVVFGSWFKPSMIDRDGMAINEKVRVEVSVVKNTLSKPCLIGPSNDAKAYSEIFARMKREPTIPTL